MGTGYSAVQYFPAHHLETHELDPPLPAMTPGRHLTLGYHML